MKKIIIFLIFFFIIFFVSGEKLATFDDIFKPRQFQVEGDDLYIVQGSVIKVFSMKDFKLITQFGKQGEGPGEFRFSPHHIQVFPDRVLASHGKKITVFSRRGKIIKEKESPGFSNLYDVKGNYIGKKRNYDFKNEIEINKTFVLDKDFNIIKEIFTHTIKEQTSKLRNIEWVHDYIQVITNGEYIFFADTRKGFYIKIYNHEGNEIRTINKNYNKLKINEKYKKKAKEKEKKLNNRMSGRIKFNIILREYFPAFRRLSVDKTKMYVFTYKENEKNQEIIIFDLHGNLLKKVFVNTKSYYQINNSKFYYFIDNEDEELMEFHSVDL